MTSLLVRVGVGLACLTLTACYPSDPPAIDPESYAPTSAEIEAATQLVAFCDAALRVGALRPVAAEYDFELAEPKVDILTAKVVEPHETARYADYPGVEVWLAEDEDGPACMVGTNSAHRRILAIWSVLLEARRGEGGATAAQRREGWWPLRRETQFSVVDIRPAD